MPSKWRMEVEGWLKTLDVTGSVLDVGGEERPVKGRTKSWEVDEYIIADLPGFDLNDPLLGKVKPADTVFCLETVMYTHDPVKAIENLVSLTEKNLYVSNPLEAYPETKPPKKDQHRLFPNWWQHWLKELGMKIEYMRVVAPMMSNNQFKEAIAREGYKVYRPHASGVLIHATKV